MQEANGLVNDAYYSEREAIVSDILDGLQNEPQDWNCNNIKFYLNKETHYEH